jgi:hypothetical protein
MAQDLNGSPTVWRFIRKMLAIIFSAFLFDEINTQSYLLLYCTLNSLFHSCNMSCDNFTCSSTYKCLKQSQYTPRCVVNNDSDKCILIC